MSVLDWSVQNYAFDRFTNDFLPSILASFMSSFLPREQLDTLMKVMKAQTDLLVSRAFRYLLVFLLFVCFSILFGIFARFFSPLLPVVHRHQNRGSEKYYIHMSPTIKDARMFALQCALHKKYPLLASHGYASFTKPPVRIIVDSFGIEYLTHSRPDAGLLPHYWQPDL